MNFILMLFRLNTKLFAKHPNAQIELKLFSLTWITFLIFFLHHIGKEVENLWTKDAVFIQYAFKHFFWSILKVKKCNQILHNVKLYFSQIKNKVLASQVQVWRFNFILTSGKCVYECLCKREIVCMNVCMSVSVYGCV
jgi:hypothetical protein